MTATESLPLCLYIVDTNNYRGNILSTMTDGVVHYTKGKTFEEYNSEHQNGLIALTWEEYDEKYQKPWLKILCKPFKRITEAQWWEYLECLPPKKRRHIGEFETFFVGECFTATLYEFCFAHNGRYWSGLRDLYTSEEELLNEMKKKI